MRDVGLVGIGIVTGWLVGRLGATPDTSGAWSSS